MHGMLGPPSIQEANCKRNCIAIPAVVKTKSGGGVCVCMYVCVFGACLWFLIPYMQLKVFWRFMHLHMYQL